MSRFRGLKRHFIELCSLPDWRQALDRALAGEIPLKEAVNALLGLLPRPEFRLQAAYGLGMAVSRLARTEMESARVIMRRLMWSLNEESGNLGWGVPEAMGAILAMSPALAGEYARIFLSYGYETGRHDNFLDYAPLRCGVYAGASMLASANFTAARPILAYLAAALSDADAAVRASAALLFRTLVQEAPLDAFTGPVREEWEKALKAVKLAEGMEGGEIRQIYVQNGEIISEAAQSLLEQGAALAEKRLEAAII